MVIAMNVAELDPRLEPIAKALIGRSNGRCDPTFVRGLVANIAAEFEGVRVRDFVDVLVAKEAADELRRLDALQTISSS